MKIKIGKATLPDPENNQDTTSNETSQFTDPVYDEQGAPTQERTTPNVTVVNTPAAEGPVVDRSKSDELVKNLFSIRQPEPTPDNERLNRIARMGKVNTIARGVNVLGDILSLSQGANVNKSQPDTQTPELTRQYQATLDKFKNDTDTYKLRNYAQAREDAKFGITYEMRKEAQALQEAQMKARTVEARAKVAQDWNKLMLNLDDKQKERLFKAEENKKNRAVQMEFKKRSQKPLTIMTSHGNRYELSPEEFSFLTNEANGNENVLNDPKYSKWFDKVETTKQVPNKRFGGYDKVPTGEYTYKIKKGADKFALAQAMLELHEQGKISLPGRRDQSKNENDLSVPEWKPPVPGTITGPAVGSHAPQPPTNKVPGMFQGKPDYSSLNFGNNNTDVNQYSTGGLY